MSLVFGKYEKIRRIAQGGMGEVYLARQTGVLDRLAILKSLRGDLASDKDLVEQFLDEARVAATLNHPNIVSIFDVGEWHGTYYIAMEYVPGEDLSKLWYAAAKAGVGLPFQVSVRVCFEAAHGLEHAHKAKDVRGVPLNVVHRDVSPQNIMVRGDGVVKLVDFGIAKAANKSSRTQAGMVKGKLQYMSPEQVRGEVLDGRSDQFSLGVVLWEMCTGRRLFKADSEINTLQKILQSPIPKPSEHVPGFPPELEATILKMLQRDAERRFKHLGEVASELKGYLDRSAMAGGAETTVAAFVQQILGKELDDRIADLTPMEATEAGAPLPRAPSKAVAKPAPNDAPTVIVDDDGLDSSPAPSGSWSVKLADGRVLSVGDMATLHQWILDGQVVGDDSFAADGKTWKKLKDAPQFLKFLEIAIAARSVAAKPRSGPGRAPSPPSPHTVTKPLADGPRANQAEAMSLGVPPSQDRDHPMTGAFQLGDLPPSQTGTWGAPDIALAVAAARGAAGRGEAQAAGRVVDSDAHIDGQTTELLTPTGGQLGTSPPEARVAARLPTVVWVLGGIVVALALVVTSLAVVAPDLLASFFRGAADHTEVIKAIAAARDDDPGAIDALLKDAEALAEQSRDDTASDAAAAAALLHLARARIDAEAAELSALATQAAGTAGPSTGKPDAEAHRVAAYKLATRALAASQASPGALLAMASYQAERGALAELEADAAHALALAKGSSIEASVTSEVGLARAMVAARGSLAGKDPVALRAAAATLATIDDARARSSARVLRARAATLAARAGERGARADVQALRIELRTLDSGDARVAALATLMKLLDNKLGDDNAPPDVKTPDVKAPDVKAPDVKAPDGADAGVAALVVDAGPPPPAETFESALDKARKAAGQKRSREAARWAKKALELRPPGGGGGVIEAQIMLGFAYIDLGVLESARQTFRQVLAKEPKNCDAQIGFATVLDQQQKTEDARKEYMSYVENCPDGKDVEAAKGAISRLE